MECPVRIRYRPRIPLETLLHHVRSNIARALPVLEAQPVQPVPLAVVAGGPSLNATIPLLRQMAAAGGRILAVNEVPHVLLKHGIRPFAAAHVGPVDLTLRSMGQPIDGVIYYMASICPPAAFDALRNHSAVLWHPQIADAEAEMRAAGADNVVSGGCTVGLLCLSIGAALGYRTIHFHGGDSSFEPAGAFHAYGSVADAIGHHEMTVRCGGRAFATTPELLGQALAFPHLRAQLASGGTQVTVHGDGLLPFRESCRLRDGAEPAITIEPRPGMTPGPDGAVEIDAQMF